MQASKVGIKFNPATLGVEFKEDPSTGTRPDAALIDVSGLLAGAGSDRALLEAVREKNPDVISADVVSLPQVLRLLGQLRVKAVAGASPRQPAPAPAAAAAAVTAPVAASASSSPSSSPSAASSPPASSGKSPSKPASTALGKTTISVGTRIQGKRPNWSKPYEGSVTKVNHNKVPVTLNIHFDDGSDEKFFPLKYLVGTKRAFSSSKRTPRRPGWAPQLPLLLLTAGRGLVLRAVRPQTPLARALASV